MLVLDPIQHRMARGSFIHSYTGGSWISAIPTYGFLRHCRHNGDQQKTCVIKKTLFPMKLPKIHGKNMEKPCLEIPTWTNPTICSLQFYQNVQKFSSQVVWCSGDGGIDVVESGNQKTDACFFGVAGKRWWFSGWRTLEFLTWAYIVFKTSKMAWRWQMWLQIVVDNFWR